MAAVQAGNERRHATSRHFFPTYRIMKRKLAAILCADAAGYSRLMGRDETGTLAALKVGFELMHKSVARHGGRVAAVHGDSLLAEFASVVDAVRCAMEIQDGIRTGNERLPADARMPFRLGIALGEVVEEEDGTIDGDGVNVARHLEGLADDGGICISRSVHDQVRNKLPLAYESLGARRVGHLAEPVEAYRVLSGPDAAEKTGGKSGFKRWQKAASGLAAALLLLAGGLTIRKYAGRDALPLPDKPSIAVLPLENLTGDPKQEYLADGFTEQIITSLSKISSLFVISRNSSFTYKGKPAKVRQVSADLGVRYLLEGSIQKSGSRVRINVQLIDAIEDRHLWAETYDRAIQDVFALQDEIDLKILTALQVNLTAGEQARIWAKGTKNLGAYLKLMEARDSVRRSNVRSNVEARRLAEEAIALDPTCAEAYAYVGATHVMDVWLGASKSPGDSLAQAVDWTQKALAIDNSLAHAHARLGYLYVISPPHRYDDGVAEAEKAVTMDPNSAVSYYFLGMALRFAGRHEEAIRAMKMAIRLEPLSPGIYYQNLALPYLLKGDCEEAVKASGKALECERDNMMTYLIATAAYSSCGRARDARKTAGELLRLNPNFSAEVFAKRLPYRNPRDRERVITGLRNAGL